MVDKRLAEILEKESNEALEQVAARHNLTYHKGRGTYGSEGYSFKSTYQAKIVVGSIESMEYNMYFTRVEGFDATKSIIGARVRFTDGKYGIISGYKSSNRRNPVLGEHEGRGYRFSLEFISEILY